ncbi:MAG: LytTR family DNA-binding domain-containing protein [Agriterribacter sp.]
MPIRTLIVDDEPHAIDIICRYATNVPDIEIVTTCNNAIHAFQVLQHNKIDLLFADIKMPGLSGTDLIRSLKKPPMVVFTTAYQEYAVEGFDLNAIDYLVKPIPLNRFLRAVDKVMHYIDGNNNEDDDKSGTVATAPGKHFLYLRIERQTIKIDTEDIRWIESIRDYIKVITKDKVYVTKQKISVAEKLLPTGHFMRIHRSFIIPLNKIESYHPNYFTVAGAKIPIGRNYKLACMEKFHDGTKDPSGYPDL